MLRIAFVQHCAQEKVRNVKNDMALGLTRVRLNPDGGDKKSRRGKDGKKAKEDKRQQEARYLKK